VIDFHIGTVVLFETSSNLNLREFLRTLEIDSLAEQFREHLQSLRLTDLGVLLFGFEPEKFSWFRRGAYGFPDFGGSVLFGHSRNAR
jgi:hypothetical protein